MSAFIQKVLPEAMTNYRLHLALIKSYMLDSRFAAKYPIDSELRTIKDMNYVTSPGLYRLTKDTRNYCNPEDKSNQYWYEPTKDTTGMPSRSVAFAYIIPLTNEYTRQYVLLGAEGHIDIKTRLGYKTGEDTKWGKWREYADRNPSYELLQNTTGKADTNYISFGNYELSLPDAKESNLGTVIRLDQWKGQGRVYSVEGYRNPETGKIAYHEKDTVDTYPSLMTYGSDIALKIGTIKTTLNRQSMFEWSDDVYRLTALLIYDKFYWSIYQNDVELYRSEQCVEEAAYPSQTAYRKVVDGVPSGEVASIELEETQSFSDESMIETCNTYEFEVFNDHEPYNSQFNYWVMFCYNTASDATARMTQFYNQSINGLKQDIYDVHTRITSEVNILNNTINLVSSQLADYVDRSIYEHNYDISAHPYILALIKGGGGSGGEGLASHIIDPDAHTNIITPIKNTINNIQETIVNVRYQIYQDMTTLRFDLYNQIGYVSADLVNYVDLTSASISDYIANLSWNMYLDMHSCCDYMTSLIYTVSQDLSNYTAMVSCDLSAYTTLVSGELSQYVDITSKEIKDYIDSLSWHVANIDPGVISVYVFSGLDGYTTSDGHYVYISGIPATYDAYGMVKTIDYIDYIYDTSSSYVVPTVNAVSTFIYNISGGLYHYIGDVSSDLSRYVDVTSKEIKDYIDKLSWNVEHMDAGVMYVSVYSGLHLNSYFDGHYIEISGLPATYDSYGMVYVTSIVESYGPAIEERHYIVPDTNAVYDALKQISGLVTVVSRDVSNDLYDTSWSIADYIYHMSSAIIDYIDTVDSGIIEVSGLSGIYTELTANGRSAFISGLPATETSYGMVYAATSVGWMADTDITKDYTVPTVNAVMNLYGLISNQIYQVSGDLSTYVDITSKHLSYYVDITSKEIKDYIDNLSWQVDHINPGLISIYAFSGLVGTTTEDGHYAFISGIPATYDAYGMVYTTDQITLIYDATSSYTVPTVNAVSIALYNVQEELSNQITIVSGQLETFVSTVSGELSAYVDITSKEIKDYIDALSWSVDHIDPGVVSVYAYGGLEATTVDHGHIVLISGIPATYDTYGMVQTIDHIEYVYGNSASYTVPTVNAVSTALYRISGELSNYTYLVSGGLSNYIYEVSGRLSTFTREVSQEIIDYINGLPKIDPGVISVYVNSGLYGYTTNYGHFVSIIGIPADYTSYGMVYTHDTIEMIYGEVSRYTVPTVNAVSNALTTLSGEITDYISIVSGGLSKYTYEVSGHLSSYISTVSGELSNYIDEQLRKINPGVISVYVDSGLYGLTMDYGHVVSIIGLPATETSYGMVYVHNKIETIYGETSDYTVPTVNAVSYAIATLSAEISEYVTVLSGDIAEYISIVSSGLSNYTYEVSGGLSKYISEVSGDLSNYIDEQLRKINPGVISVYVDSGLYGYTTDYGHIVSIIGLPASYTSYGMVYTQDNLNPVFGETSKYTVPTVNAVSFAIATLSAEVSEYVTIVSGAISNTIYEVSGGLVEYISTVSGQLSTFTREVSQEIIEYINGLPKVDPGIVSIYLDSGIGGFLTENGHYAYISGIAATEDVYGMVYVVSDVVSFPVTDSRYWTAVPRTNAVYEALGKLSSVFGTYTSGIYGVKPIYVSRFGNDYQIELAHDTNFYGGVQVSTITHEDGSTYLVANAQQPDEGDALGTVKTVGYMTLINDPSSAYVVPTVNAVSKAITDAIYTQIPPQIYNFTSTIFVEIGSQYIPWIAVMDVQRIHPDANTFGANFLTSAGRLYVYNDYATGDGWPTVTDHTKVINDFGTVITWNQVSRIDTDVHMELQIDPYGREGIRIDGNPGDKFVVPTVNAVYDALMELSAKIPTITSRVINIVSEMYVENHLHNYITVVSHISRFFVTSITEVHYDQIVSINAYSGIKANRYDDSTYELSGLPAGETSYGMVFVQEKLEWVEGIQSAYTVPTVNALLTSLAALTSNIPEISVYSGLHLDSGMVDGRAVIAISGLPATVNDYGMVKTIEEIVWIPERSSGYVVPTVNAVHDHLTSYVKYENAIGGYNGVELVPVEPEDEHGESSLIAYGEPVVHGVGPDGVGAIFGVVATVSRLPDELINISVLYDGRDGLLSDFTDAADRALVPTVNAVVQKFGEISALFGSYTSRVIGVVPIYTSRYGNDYQVELAIDSAIYGGVMVSTVTAADGSTYLVATAQQPDANTKLGTVKTSSKLNKVVDETSDYTVPTVNAVIEAISGAVPNILADEPIYATIGENNVTIGLRYSYDMSNGVRLAGDVDEDDKITLRAEAQTANGWDDIGTVKTIESVTYINATSSYFVVPTVNAVSIALTELSSVFGTYTSRVDGYAPIYTSRSGNDYQVKLAYDTLFYGGVQVSTITQNDSTYLIAAAQQPDAAEKLGTVKTSDTLNRVEDDTSNFTVPTVNAVIDAIAGAVPNIKGIEPVYKELNGSNVSIGLHYTYSMVNGVRLVGYVTDDDEIYLGAEAQTANGLDELGTVKTIENIAFIHDTSSAFVVPTVNAVSIALTELSSVFGTYTSRVFGQEPIYTSRNGNDYLVNLAYDTTFYGGVQVSTITQNDSTYLIAAAQQPNAGDKIGTVKTSDTLNRVEDETSDYTVPTVNAVIDAIEGAVPNILTNEPIYKTVGEDSVTIGLRYSYEKKNGVGLTGSVDGDEITLKAEAQTANEGDELGTVKTIGSVTYITAASSAFVVPTVNAVSTAIARISGIFGTYTSRVEGLAPIYTSRQGNDYQVALAYDTEFYGGVHVSTITQDGSTYLMAEAQQPDAGDKLGTVKTVDFITLINDPSSVYVVPTVNAVSKAITDAIYTQLPPEIYNFTSTIYVEIGSQYIPWIAVMDHDRISPNANTLGANFYTSNNKLYVYNDYADGNGWRDLGTTNPVANGFGAVITWDKVSRIETYVQAQLKIDPNGPEVVDINGNPGDMFVVPTVNAVYDALMELSAKIPTITSKHIYIVSEMYVENHLHNYVTVVSHISNFFVTSITEVHYDQMISINAFSGIRVNKYNESTYELSGLPAGETSYGMVFVKEKLEWVEGIQAAYTVPTVNAILTSLGALTSNIPDISVYSGLYLNSAIVNGRAHIAISGLPANVDSYGMVKTIEEITWIPEPSSGYVVPTVNAIYDHLSSYVKYENAHGGYNGVELVPVEPEDEHDESSLIAYGEPVVHGIGPDGVGAIFGVVATVSRLPEHLININVLYTGRDGALSDFTDAADRALVPTVNAVVQGIGKISSLFGTYTSAIYGIPPVYTSRSGNDYAVMLAIDSTRYGGVLVSTVTAADGYTYLMADAQQPDAATKIGTVKTSDTLNRVEDETSNFTVPTVNAVLDALDELVPTVHGIEPVYKEVNGTDVSIGLHYTYDMSNGVRLAGDIDGTKVILRAEAQTANGMDQIGTVKTIEEITYITAASNYFIVPTVNAVSAAIANISRIFGTYTSRVFGVAPVYTSRLGNDYQVKLAIDSTIYGGVMVSTMTTADGSTYLLATAQQPNAGAKLGTVKTSDTLNRVEDETSDYTVPTVNAVIDAIDGAVPNILTNEPIYATPGDDNVTIGLHYTYDMTNGVRLTGKINGNEVSLAAEAQTANGLDALGTVKTIEDITYITAASSAFVVPTVNAVSKAIANISNVFGKYTSKITGVHPIYTSKNGNEYQVELAYDPTYYGGVQVSTITHDGSTYLIADAHQPNEGDQLGTVKTVGYITWIFDESSAYVVPTVNAVSKAITDAIYTTVPPEIYNITSLIYIGIGSQYIPWSAVMDSKRISPYANTLGANLYTSAEKLYVYNDYADGNGWRDVGTQHPVAEGFGAVITWDKVSLIETEVNEKLPIDPDGVDTIDINGNPGELFVVPTVNAVYRALMELSAKIPTITSQVINIVSEVYTENHLHNYITIVSHVSYINLTSITEVHYDQMVSINAYSGLKLYKQDDSAYEISGLPACETSYGMVFVQEVLQWVDGIQAPYTVPTVNAILTSLGALTSNIPEISVYSGLELNSAMIGNHKTIAISGLPANTESYGMVKTIEEIKWINEPSSMYVVPTVNTIHDVLSSYVRYEDAHGGYNGVTLIASNPEDWDEEEPYVMAYGEPVAHGIDSTGIGALFGVVATVSKLPLEPMDVAVQYYGIDGELSYFTDAGNRTLVPTVNAVIGGLGMISTLFGTYTSRVLGSAPIYTTREGNDYTVKLAIDSAWHSGIRVSTITTEDTSTYLTVEAQKPDEHDELGTVKTIGNIIWIFDPSSAYVVPTVNAVYKAITSAIYEFPIATEDHYGGVRIGDIYKVINAGIVSAMTHTSFIGALSDYVPWDAIHDYDHYDPAQYNLGANLYIYKPEQTEDKTQWELYTYNEYADGAGWDGAEGRRTTDNFGTVITWDKVSRINTVVAIEMPVVPWDDREDAPATTFQGNPGDAFVVPTVNAVYDALMELSAKIPHITSQVIVVVSEVYTTNHLHNYITVHSDINYVNLTSITEVHYDQIVSINTFSGITHEKVAPDTYNISGLPATNAEYGMVFITDTIGPIPGAVGAMTAPTMNALYTTDSTLQSHLNNHPQGKIYDADAPIYIDEDDYIGLDAVYGVFNGVELGVNEDGDLYAMGHPAMDGKIGGVSTLTTVISMPDSVPEYIRRYHVPTVNAVYNAIAAVSTNMVGKPPIYTSRNGKTNQVELAIDSTLYGGVKVSTITAENGSTYLIGGADQPNAAELIGTVKTQANLNLVGNDSDNYTVPTVNAVSKAVFDAIYTQIPGDTIVDHHTTIVDCGSNYVPWEAVRDIMYTHEVHHVDDVHTFGANFYVFTSNGTPAGLYTFNNIAKGNGLPPEDVGHFDQHFGTVITWDKVSRVEMMLNQELKIDSDATAAVLIEGNPGDMFIVPTVNAVYDALMELSAKIPTITSRIITIVSEVFTTNHLHNYVTIHSDINYINLTSITEVHYDQIVSINAYSGLIATKPKMDTYNISGLPACDTSYGMVLVKNEIEQTDGAIGNYTVADINATWRLSSAFNSHINNHPGGDDDPNYMFGGDINGGAWIRTTEIGQYTRVEAIGDIAYKSAYNNVPKIMRGPVYVTDRLDYYGDLSYDTATLIKTHNDSHYATVPNVKLVSTLANVLYDVSNYVAHLEPGGGGTTYTVDAEVRGGVYISAYPDGTGGTALIGVGDLAHSYAGTAGKMHARGPVYVTDQLDYFADGAYNGTYLNKNHTDKHYATVPNVKLVSTLANVLYDVSSYVAGIGQVGGMPIHEGTSLGVSVAKDGNTSYNVFGVPASFGWNGLAEEAFWAVGVVEVHNTITHIEEDEIGYNNTEKYKYTVPTLNALYDVSSVLATISQYVDEHVYYTFDTTQVRNGVKLSKNTGIIYPYAYTATPLRFGTVKTQSVLARLENNYHSEDPGGVYNYVFDYTVPTVNAIANVLDTFSRPAYKDTFYPYSRHIGLVEVVNDDLPLPAPIPENEFLSGKYMSAGFVVPSLNLLGRVSKDLAENAGTNFIPESPISSRIVDGQKRLGLKYRTQYLGTDNGVHLAVMADNDDSYPGAMYAYADLGGAHQTAGQDADIKHYGAGCVYVEYPLTSYLATTGWEGHAVPSVQAVYDAMHNYESFGQPAQSTAGVTNGWKLGVVKVHSEIVSYGTQTETINFHTFSKWMYHVPSVDALYNHAHDATLHGAGIPATTTTPGIVTLTNTVTQYDTTHVPTASAVYAAIQGAGGGGEVRYPNYGSATGIGAGPGGSTVASGTAGSKGCWVLVSITFTNDAEGCVGIGIGGGYIPIAIFRGGSITQMFPIPPNQSWTIYNQAGTGASILYRVL